MSTATETHNKRRKLGSVPFTSNESVKSSLNERNRSSSSSRSIIPPLPQTRPTSAAAAPDRTRTGTGSKIQALDDLGSISLDADAVRRHMLALMEGEGQGEGIANGSGSDGSDRSDGANESESESESESEDNKESSDPTPRSDEDQHKGEQENEIPPRPSNRPEPSAESDRNPTRSRVSSALPSRSGLVVRDTVRAPLNRSAVHARSKELLVKEDLPVKTDVGTRAHDGVSPALTSFASMPISPVLIRALRSLSLHTPTLIQSACFKPLLSGRDVIGLAQTGSGKTIAFALPILQRLSLDPFGIFALVLTPTRELAYQLSEQFLALGRPLGLETSTVVGGMDMMAQAAELRGRPHVVIATPGRLCDLLRSCSAGEWDLRRVKVLVLDEADRLLTPTFAPDLAYLFSELPMDRQTCLFTATISPAIQALADRPPRKGKDPIFFHRIQSDTLTVENLRQRYLFIPGHVRDPYLIHLLKQPPKEIAHLARRNAVSGEDQDRVVGHKGQKGRKRKAPPSAKEEEQEEGGTLSIPSTIIFTQRCATAHLLHLLLKELDIPSVPLHSRLTQPERLASLARFRAGSVPVLVTTDVGSRGLDIPEVAMVINWDCPRTGEDYVHRVGRTARAGRGGMAITIVTERDVDLVKGIEQLTNVKLTELELSEETVLEQLNVVATARRVANMAMHDSDFGERQATNKAKDVKRAKRDARARA